MEISNSVMFIDIIILSPEGFELEYHLHTIPRQRKDIMFLDMYTHYFAGIVQLRVTAVIQMLLGAKCYFAACLSFLNSVNIY